MSVSKSSMRTPLGRVKRFGAAGSGTGDFWRQRLTAIAMVLLIVPVIAIVITASGRSYDATVDLLGSPIVAIVLMLFIIAGAWHMKLGLQVVIEDYVHDDKLKLVSVIANNFFSVAVALAAIFAIVKLSAGV
jgi:succinate dehydrogenase / fumarate reductase membrane anchor subunit